MKRRRRPAWRSPAAQQRPSVVGAGQFLARSAPRHQATAGDGRDNGQTSGAVGRRPDRESDRARPSGGHNAEPLSPTAGKPARSDICLVPKGDGVHVSDCRTTTASAMACRNPRGTAEFTPEEERSMKERLQTPAALLTLSLTVLACGPMSGVSVSTEIPLTSPAPRATEPQPVPQQLDTATPGGNPHPKSPDGVWASKHPIRRTAR
jgi:hypothetical protein